MNNDEQRVFIKETLKNLENVIIADVPRMPEGWNGFQIRQFIADRFERLFVERMDSAQKRQYRRDVREIESAKIKSWTSRKLQPIRIGDRFKMESGSEWAVIRTLPGGIVELFNVKQTRFVTMAHHRVLEMERING